MVLDAVGELACVREADLGVAVICRSAPASTSAASRAIGTPAMPNAAPVLTNASAAVGSTAPKACCQATDARGMNAMPFCSR